MMPSSRPDLLKKCRGLDVAAARERKGGLMALF